MVRRDSGMWYVAGWYTVTMLGASSLVKFSRLGEPLEGSWWLQGPVILWFLFKGSQPPRLGVGFGTFLEIGSLNGSTAVLYLCPPLAYDYSDT